ncbi:hypothetical protein MPL1032_340025 [Mesorhizobium plurifarium]|uniref:Uncharacterized protein n=1 Tax=Mesorhizobium plurifarium TaxID=69974 RepID=A0A0K2W4R4_MESPL|nr:hypothetical protein MPL1032_340025 [Mesorhizobium plurifarium]
MRGSSPGRRDFERLPVAQRGRPYMTIAMGVSANLQGMPPEGRSALGDTLQDVRKLS